MEKIESLRKELERLELIEKRRLKFLSKAWDRKREVMKVRQENLFFLRRSFIQYHKSLGHDDIGIENYHNNKNRDLRMVDNFLECVGVFLGENRAEPWMFASGMMRELHKIKGNEYYTDPSAIHWFLN